ncbi:MAG TPA: hypothetical protein DIT64_17605 [Verrucomicrobiales bacterium]|nr:hypothetical protein [Verrucomicrobiales bacterium]
MKTDDHLKRLLQAARASILDADEKDAAPPGLATRLAARAWDRGENPSVPWLRGMASGMAACASLALAAHFLVPYQQPVPEMFAPFLTQSSAKPAALAMR